MAPVPVSLVPAARRVQDGRSRGCPRRLPPLGRGFYFFCSRRRRHTRYWRDWSSDVGSSDLFPAVEGDPDVLYVDEGQILTSAGTAAGNDLCLHMVRRDHGAEVANAFARRLVVSPHRDGGQSQYVRSPVAERPGGGPLEETLEWATANLGEPLTVARLSAHAPTSERTFARRFREVTGTTPLRWLLGQRILAAQSRLETSDDP